MNIIFICTGNTCRSPLAEAIARELWSESKESFNFSSAGTQAIGGLKASENSMIVARENKLELKDFLSRRLNRKEVEKADLLLCMTLNHKNIINNEYPQLKEKTFTLKEFCGKEGDISDPFGKDLQEYRRCFNEIRDCLKTIKDKDLFCTSIN